MDYETTDVVVRKVEAVTIVRLRNPNLIDSAEIQRVGSEIDLLLDRGVRKIVLDFKYVRYAGSATLGMLITLQKKVAGLKGKLVLSHSEQIAELLRVSHTAGLFTLAADPRAAFKLFN